MAERLNLVADRLFMRVMLNTPVSTHLSQPAAALHQESAEFVRIDALNAEAWALMDKNPVRAAEVAAEALACARNAEAAPTPTPPVLPKRCGRWATSACARATLPKP